MTVLPAQRRHLLDRAARDLEEPLAEVEDRRRCRRRTAARCRAGGGGGTALMPRRSRSTTRSGSPRSVSMTRTDSRAVVCTLDAHEVGLDRQLAPAAVDQRRQLDRARAAVVGQHVHGGADGAAREQHVVDQDDGLPVDRLGQLGGADLGLGQAAGTRRRGRARCRPRPAAACASPRRRSASVARGAAPGTRRRCGCRPGRAAARPAACARPSRAPCGAACARCRPASRSSRRSLEVAVGRRNARQAQSEIVPDEEVRERAPDAAPPSDADRPERARRARSRTGRPGPRAGRSTAPARRRSRSAARPPARRATSTSCGAAGCRPPLGLNQTTLSSGLAADRQVPPVAEQQRQPDDRADAEVRVERLRAVSPAAERRTRAPRVERQVARPPVAHGDRAHVDRRSGVPAAPSGQPSPARSASGNGAGIEAARLDAEVPDDRVVVGRRRGLVGGRDGPTRDAPARARRRRAAARAAGAGARRGRRPATAALATGGALGGRRRARRAAPAAARPAADALHRDRAHSQRRDRASRIVLTSRCLPGRSLGGALVVGRLARSSRPGAAAGAAGAHAFLVAGRERLVGAAALAQTLFVPGQAFDARVARRVRSRRSGSSRRRSAAPTLQSPPSAQSRRRWCRPTRARPPW